MDLPQETGGTEGRRGGQVRKGDHSSCEGWATKPYKSVEVKHWQEVQVIVRQRKQQLLDCTSQGGLGRVHDAWNLEPWNRKQPV